MSSGIEENMSSSSSSSSGSFPTTMTNGKPTTTGSSTSTTSDHYELSLEEVHTRFILNVPESELASADRLFFQLEQAWWFYEDLICDVHPEYNLPRFATFKPFAKMMFSYSSVLPNCNEQFNHMWQQFTAYKQSIGNYGCILITQDYSKMILCQVYNGKSLTFPAGKINHGEDGPTAAARETYEETGFDPLCLRGITAMWKEQTPEKITWNTEFTEQDMLVHQDSHNFMQQNPNNNNVNNNNKLGKRRTCYVVAGVPEDFPFEPVCRKEVSDIDWYPIDEHIPKPSFGVIPFLVPLKRWIRKQLNKQQQQQQDNMTMKLTHNKIIHCIIVAIYPKVTHEIDPIKRNEPEKIQKT
jgi:mRNA-decapping enzyme subunit 2